MGAVALALVGVATARADLLTAGARSGSVTATATGNNSGPGASPVGTNSVTVPTTGTGTATTGTVYANPFFAGTGTPPTPVANQQLGTASSTVNLGQVAGNSYSLSAAANFAFTTGTNSGQVLLSPSYTFDQKVIATQAESFSLTVTVTRPQFGSYSSVSLPTPSLTFAGAGVSDTLAAPYPYTGVSGPVATPTSVTQTFTGLLQPGTYSFDSSFTAPQIAFLSGTPGETDSASVAATLTTTAVPEPATAAVLLLTGSATLLRRRQR